MLLIAPPAGALDAPDSRTTASPAHIQVMGRDGSAVDSMAVTKEGLGGDLSELAAVNSRVEAARQSTLGDEDEYRLVEPEDAGALTAPPIQGGSMPVGVRHEETTPHIPSAEWTSDSTHRTRQYLLIAFLGVSGITLAGVLFWGFLRWHSADRATQVSTQVPHAEEAPTPTLPSDPQGAIDSRDPAMAAEPQVDTAPTRADATPEPLPVAPLPDASAPAGVALTTEVPVSPATEPVTTPVTTPVTEPASAPQLPKQLAAFAPMLNYEIQPQFPDAMEVASEAPVTAEDLGLTASTGLPEVAPVDLSVQAQVPISGLVIGALPTSQFVSLWSNLSGIPTVVELDTLAAAAIDRRQKLALSLVQATTVGDLIPQLGQAIGLRADARENRYLQLAAPAEAMEQKLPSAVRLDNLVVDAAGEAWLRESLVQLFPELDVTWSVADGNLTRPTAADGNPLDPLAWFAVVRMIEGWRMAAGQPSTLDQYPPQQLSAALLSSAEVPGLDTKLKQVTAQAHPVAQVLPRICQEAGVDAWIDWANVGAVGLGPQSTALFVTTARPLRRVLADYATEFSLTVAILDESSLWITSNQAYRSSPQRYVIPSDDRTAEEWKSQLRALTPAASDRGGVGSVVVVPTLDEKFMLVRCCRPVVSF
jgi:hypothetical protein